MGPLKFILEDSQSKKKFTTSLGTHHCTCPTFTNEQELCVHILWLMIKVFKISPDSETIFQMELGDREIDEIMNRKSSKKAITAEPKIPENHSVASKLERDQLVERRPIEEGDVCPICQEDLANEAETIFCYKSCGNSIHTKCLKVLKDHAKSLSMDVVKCPLCRKDFGSIPELEEIITERIQTSSKLLKSQKPKKHFATTCDECKVSPITGNCYRCLVCKTLYLCEDCFSSGKHSQHTFETRPDRKEPWKPAQRTVPVLITDGVMNALQSRDLTDNDYETLLTLGETALQGNIPLHIVNSFPTHLFKNLRTEPIEKCLVCNSFYKSTDLLRRIPCGHYYHRQCIDRWLLQIRSTCPTCNIPAYTSVITDINAISDPDTIRNDSEEYRATEPMYKQQAPLRKVRKKKKVKDIKVVKSVVKKGLSVSGTTLFGGVDSDTTPVGTPQVSYEKTLKPGSSSSTLLGTPVGKQYFMKKSGKVRLSPLKHVPTPETLFVGMTTKKVTLGKRTTPLLNTRTKLKPIGKPPADLTLDLKLDTVGLSSIKKTI